MIKYSAATKNDLGSVSKLFLDVYSGLLKKRFGKWLKKRKICARKQEA